MGKPILVVGDTFSFSGTPPFHSGGSSPLSSAGQDFVTIDGKLAVMVGTSHPSSCIAGCSMSISSTSQSFVTINGTPVAVNPSSGSMGGGHPSVTVVSSATNNLVYIG